MPLFMFGPMDSIVYMNYFFIVKKQEIYILATALQKYRMGLA